MRALEIIAREIRADWHPISYSAAPYLDAMLTMNSINEDFGYDSGSSIIRYFLSNAKTWKGDKARHIKAELKAMLKG